MRNIKIGASYKHFKNKLYKVIDIVKDCEEPDRQLVIYQALYGSKEKWAREYNDFLSEVDKNKYPDVNQKYRFEEYEN